MYPLSFPFFFPPCSFHLVFLHALHVSSCFASFCIYLFSLPCLYFLPCFLPTLTFLSTFITFSSFLSILVFLLPCILYFCSSYLSVLPLLFTYFMFFFLTFCISSFFSFTLTILPSSLPKFHPSFLPSSKPSLVLPSSLFSFIPSPFFPSSSIHPSWFPLSPLQTDLHLFPHHSSVMSSRRRSYLTAACKSDPSHFYWFCLKS